MVEIRDCINQKKFVAFLKNIGIDVHLNTKARGHSGFCTGKRIDVSKNLPQNRVIEVLLHEFAHFVHFKLEPELIKSHGTLSVLFDTDEVNSIAEELFQITLIVFDTVDIRKINRLKDAVNEKIKEERVVIKEDYPDFAVNKKFKEFDRYIRHSKAKYLLKYDCVIIRGGWFAKDETISVKSIEKDFPAMPKAFAAYIKMKSNERKRNRLNARVSKIKRYLKQPTELFARFFQLYCCDIETVKSLAPIAYSRFEELRKKSYYPYLEEFFSECVENSLFQTY